jgi:hypothetical protein
VDSAASALRFVARRCELTAEGVRATPATGPATELPWDRIAALWVRQLPPDRPWDSQLVLDIQPAQASETLVEPVRVFATTILQLALAGSPSTSRLENLRRLAAFVAAHAPSLAMDPETRAFIEAVAAPARLARMADFAAYDARYPPG